ncbi:MULTISPECIES: outer membrane protein assembly factor BamD [Ectothiorhodospira]|uniref:Outer membrane protein assembly factor BamD n=1 Tax=Ectothiorhodospira marina TaxID=1396821 RepID=A0A1H7HDY4_9GAMM|nr:MULTISPECIES: outer membrane protein assembly factor BamD [Ectothiorhodospira]MCG5515051.1 outer membrane protein assembly factor BamD [Ectothiorhodospira sp. 9100]MCG5517769.1 outer membrane protein assembly factor BamD [Ectothiorhodospira sp. 9905]SEK48428.1 Beta-barrel assembly machine subunit BamD [Ectothiorhodospira marina]
MSALRNTLILILLAALISGCGAMRQDPTRDWSASQLYEEAKAALERGNYDQAVEHYETLEARFPFGRHAQQGQLEIAYAYYKAQEPEMAIAAIDRFLQMNPRHPHADYAYYLRGLTNYERDQSFLNRWVPQDQARRDPVPLRTAFEDFGTLLQYFPDSRYAQDSRERMVRLRNMLAAHEMHVADFYMRRGAWLAAAQRGRYVLEHYDGSGAVPDALEIMVRAYRELDMDDLAEDALRVLRQNFPNRADELAALPHGTSAPV